MQVLVMGATGNVGGALVDLLRARQVRVRAVSREPRAWPDGVEGVVGDANDPSSLAGAAAGMDGAFLLSGYAAEAQLLAELGAGHAALLSSARCLRAPFGDVAVLVEALGRPPRRLREWLEHNRARLL